MKPSTWWIIRRVVAIAFLCFDAALIVIGAMALLAESKHGPYSAALRGAGFIALGFGATSGGVVLMAIWPGRDTGGTKP